MKKKILSILLVVCMVLTLVPPAAFAEAEGNVDYLYCDENGANWGSGTKTAGTYTVVTSGALQWGTSGQETWYVVQGDVTIGTEMDPQRVTVNGDVHLILTDGCSLTVNGGIRVEDDDNNVKNGIANTLTVYGQSVPVLKADGAVDETNNRTGRLTANGSGIWGIGSDTGTGDITINGGIVTAEGGTAEQGSCGIMAHDITVNGGSVTAFGGETYISGGISFNLGGCLTVNGGTVVAKGGDAQAISCGIIGYNMKATGGTVLATSGTAKKFSCGIYVDQGDESEGGRNGGIIKISGKANIIATSGDAPTSVGIHAQFPLNINGGHVTARTLAGENTQRGALDRNPALSFPDTYWWRTSAEASYTEGNFVWNDAPYDTYVEITDHFTITFDTDGGSKIDPIKQDHGTDVIAPVAPTKEGYTFAGWDKEIPATMPAGDMTIKALWKVNQYTITFDTDGGTAIAPIKQDYGTDVIDPENPTREGYTFTGWDKTIPETMPAEDMTITAKWTPNQYTITFNTDGGSVIDPITQDYDTTVTAPADPTKEGYTFAGWVPAIPDTMPAEDMIITATWTKNSTGSSSSSSGFSGVYNYPVVISDVENAKATVDKNNAVAGDKVTITVTPDAGKAVDEVIVTDADGKTITVSKAGDNKYTFTMPAGKVNIAVTTKTADYQKKIVLQIGNRNILENNRTITNDVAPVIVDNRTMVPIRVITETLGGTAHWDADTQTVTLNIDGKTLTMTIGQTISGFDTAPIILNDRTYVPVRYVAEMLGASVEWIGATQQIVITK